MGDIVLTDKTNYKNIADAIRTKLGTTTKYTPPQMSAAINGIVVGGATPKYENKSVTLATVPQTITPSTGFNGLSSVEITGISTNTGYIRPTGTTFAYANVEEFDVTSYKYVNVNVPTGSSSKLEGEKEVTPAPSTQVITPSTGYDGLTSVRVFPIPSTYVNTTISPVYAASSGDIRSGKKAYVNGTLVDGNVDYASSLNTSYSESAVVTPTTNGYTISKKANANNMYGNFVDTNTDVVMCLTTYDLSEVKDKSIVKGAFTISTNTLSKVINVNELSTINGFVVYRDVDSSASNFWFYTSTYKRSVLQNGTASMETKYDTTRMTLNSSTKNITLTFASDSYSKGTYKYIVW